MTKFKPINKLEKIMAKAAKKQSARAKFYSFLLNSQIFVVPLTRPNIWNGEVAKNDNLQLMGYAEHNVFYVAFFTSAQRAEEANPSGMGLLQMSARDFFKMTKGSHLALNPNSALGKEFYPAEVEHILHQDYEPAPCLA